jgi:MYXO-CTERM domain-containing protein
MYDSLIEGNYIHHTNGPTVDQGDGIEIKEGSYNNIVRDNVIHDTNYPCILTYSTVGNGAPNVIERNLMFNCGDHAIQSAADATIRNNVILGSNADGIAMQPHQAGVPGNLVVVHNTVLHPQNDAISLSGAAGSVIIANNALYAQSGNAIGASGDLSGVVVAGNIGAGGLSGPSGGFANGNLAADFVAASYGGTLPNDVFPAAGSALIGAADATHLAEDDFNGTPRDGALDVGAYKFDASGNPGWTFAEGFKDAPAAGGSGGGSGGSSGGGGTGGAGGSGTGGSSAGSAGTGGASAESDDDGGCGCRTAPVRGSPAFAAIALAALALLRRRR